MNARWFPPHLAVARGDEAAWWESVKVDPVAIARRLWERTRLNGTPGHQKNGGVLLSASEASITEDRTAPQHVDDAKVER